MKITPENCHRIKQTVCGKEVKLIFYDLEERSVDYPVGCLIGVTLYWFTNKGKGIMRSYNFDLDLTPLSEPEPTPVAQAAINLIRNLANEYHALAWKDNVNYDDNIDTANHLEKLLTDLFTARVGETIKPL